MTGRMGQYETDMIGSVITDLTQLELYTLKDMELAFYQGSRILADNHSLNYLDNYQAFMKKHYHINL